MSDEHNVKIGYDHTHLRDRKKKIWRVGPVGFGSGLDFHGAILAVVTCVAVAGAGLLLSQAIGVTWVGAAAVVAAAAAAAGLYFLWSHRVIDGMRMKQRLLIAADWWLFQPRRFHGLTRDREPDVLEWRVIVWQPTNADWHNAHGRYVHMKRTHQAAVTDSST